MNTYTTYSSKVLDLDFVEQKDISLEDIAHSLAYQCRFNGHTKRFYSVAEHSIVLHALVQAESGVQNLERSMAALLHDAGECYTGDITQPVRDFLYVSDAREKRILEAIFGAFEISYKALDESLLAMDEDLCTVEGYVLIGGMHWSRAYHNLLRRNPEFANKAREILVGHTDVLWEKPSYVERHFSRLLVAEWNEAATIWAKLETPNVEPAE